MTATDAVAAIAALFASEGAAAYLGEEVSQAAHMLQAAALAEQDQAGKALVAAALLHDVGHFAGALSGPGRRKRERSATRPDASSAPRPATGQRPCAG